MKSAYNYVLVTLFVLSQKEVSSQVLKIGDTLPSITLENILNHTSGKLNITSLKGKAVILDFWGFSCVSCLQAFPKVDSIQQQFKKDLQILMVNRNTKMETATFFAKRNKIKMPAVPFITNDSLLNFNFPHTGVPFHVWINREGKIMHTTDGEFMTSQNIQNFLQGRQMNFPVVGLNAYEPSMFSDELESYVQYFSYVARCVDRGSYHITGLKNEGVTLKTYYCTSIKNLYQIAFNESENEGYFKFREHGRTILEVADQEKYEQPADATVLDWMEKYGYYYHAQLPAHLRNKRFLIMQQDLQRYFNLEVKIEKRKIKTLALVRTSKVDKLHSKGGTPDLTAFTIDIRNDDAPVVRYIKNMPFTSLFHVIKTMGDWFFHTKIIDHSGYKGNIDFQMDEKKLENLTVDKLQAILKKYDLELVEKYIESDVLVLKER